MTLADFVFTVVVIVVLVFVCTAVVRHDPLALVFAALVALLYNGAVFYLRRRNRRQ